MKSRKVILPILLISILALNLVVKFVEEDKLAQIYSNEILTVSGVFNEFASVSYDKFTPTEENVKVDNKIYGWGIKRMEEGKIPEPDPGTDKLIEKYNGRFIGDINEKYIYLTFDEGYENGFTPSILDTLKEYNVHATFFITGPYLQRHSELVKRMVDEGHEVANHTYSHPTMPEISNEKIREDIELLSDDFYKRFNVKMKYFRAPKGEYSERTLAVTNDMGYINLFWSFAYDDWYKDKQRGEKYTTDIVTKNLHNGAIILLHAVSNDNSAALPNIIKQARDKGYEFGNINDLFNDK